MLYVKMVFFNDIEVKVPLYEEEIVSYCYVCGLEIKYDTNTLADIIRECGFATTKSFCQNCIAKKEKEMNRKTRRNKK